jgi:folate-binding protein YgfZ
MNDSTAFTTTDTGLALLAVEGEDAFRFLDAQLMTALEDVPGFAACPAALADAKGRVTATFHVWRTEDNWRIALPADEAEWLKNHLARFIFRSRVNIEGEHDIALLGHGSEDAEAALATADLPSPPHNQVTDFGPLDIIGLPGNRWLVAGRQADLDSVAGKLAKQAGFATHDDWTRARLIAGEVEIRAATRGRYLPQMLKLDALGAISFDKGCYPGQEVIARTRNLGRIKRAVTLLRLASPLEPGTSEDIEGARIEVLDSVAFEGGALVQAVAPLPLPAALQPLVYAASSSFL